MCDAVALKIRDLLVHRLGGKSSDDAANAALFLRQGLCPGLVLLRVSQHPRQPNLGRTGAASLAPSGRSRVYVVQRGDSLWVVAVRFLPHGAPLRAVTHGWRRIWFASRSVVGPDPNTIEPGMRLSVPDPLQR